MNLIRDDKEENSKYLSLPLLFGFMLIAFILFALRRPDIIMHAQPWAEDGRVWMAGIYNNGFWAFLILPQNGYYQTISRLTYGISIFFWLSYAALSANVIAVLLRCFLIGFILSKRMNFIEIKYRFALALALAFYIILMPNVAEGFVNIISSHWSNFKSELLCAISGNRQSIAAM